MHTVSPKPTYIVVCTMHVVPLNHDRRLAPKLYNAEFYTTDGDLLYLIAREQLIHALHTKNLSSQAEPYRKAYSGCGQYLDQYNAQI